MPRIGNVDKEHGVLALGCWTFGGTQWGGQDDGDSMKAMQKAFELGLRHFDTATGYGRGHSEQLVGRFLKGKRDQVFLASKQSAVAEKDQYLASIEKSLRRLDTDHIDLYYIHWPRSDMDMRPTMEALMEAKSQGKIGAIGVSNFSVDQMEQVAEVGVIDAHQLCYNLLWRWGENQVIPYCVEGGIAVVTYSSIAQGILSGKFPRNPVFKEGDQRPETVLFGDEAWPVAYEAVEEMKAVAEKARRPLAHLAIRWVCEQQGVTSVLVGARDASQVEANAAAMEGEIAEEDLSALTAISDRAKAGIPDTGNIFRYYP